MNRVFWLLLGLVALAACSQPPADGGKADVTVSVAFPSTQGQLALDPGSFLRTLGAPPDAYGAKITITPSSGGSPIITTVTRDNPSTTVTLNTGDYSFEASVYSENDPSLEIAWGKTNSISISSDTTVSIYVTSILRSVSLFTTGAPARAGDTAQIQLNVSSLYADQWDFRVPIGDYTASWAVQNTTDTVVGNNLGAEVTWGGTSDPIAITVTVSGLGEDHQPTTMTATTNIYSFQANGNSFVLSGTLPNWNGPSDTNIVPLIYGPNLNTPVATPSAVDSATGDFNLNYFDGNAMSDISEVLLQFENLMELSCTADENWTNAPEPGALAMQSTFSLRDSNDNQIGQAWIADDLSQLNFWYVDREITVQGTCTGSDGSNYTFDLQLQPGWNAVTQTSVNGDLTVSGSGISTDSYTIPSNFTWNYNLFSASITDYGLSVAQSSYNPVEGSSIDVVITVYNYGSVDSGLITVNLVTDSGLSIIGIAGADSSAQSSFDIAVAPGTSRNVTVTVSVAQGTAGQTLNLTAGLALPDDNPANDNVTVNFNPQASGQSVNVGIAMDLNPPAVFFESPTNDETVNSQSGVYTVIIYASDTEGSIVGLELYRGYEPIATLPNGDFTQDPNDPARYSYSWDVSNLAPGEYELTAIAYDSATNASYSIVSVIVQ